MTVRTDNGQARKDDPLFGRDDMDNPLTRIADVEHGDAFGPRRFARLQNESSPARHQGVVAPPRQGVDNMIHGAEDPGRIGDRPPRRTQALERDPARALMQKHPVNGDQGPAAGILLDQMLTPDLVEKSRGC